MKIVIDIPEEYYEECKEKAKTGIGSYTRIAEGTPLKSVDGLIDKIKEKEIKRDKPFVEEIWWNCAVKSAIETIKEYCEI